MIYNPCLRLTLKITAYVLGTIGMVIFGFIVYTLLQLAVSTDRYKTTKEMTYYLSDTTYLQVVEKSATVSLKAISIEKFVITAKEGKISHDFESSDSLETSELTIDCNLNTKYSTTSRIKVFLTSTSPFKVKTDITLFYKIFLWVIVNSICFLFIKVLIDAIRRYLLKDLKSLLKKKSDPS